jgi:Cdc6-like AAA superfamily ATPase
MECVVFNHRKEELTTGFKIENAGKLGKRRTGRTVSIPSDEEMRVAPAELSAALWEVLVDRYNRSQLFAIRHVVQEVRSEGQDTKIVLVQGPPGTGKTSTVRHSILYFVWLLR